MIASNIYLINRFQHYVVVFHNIIIQYNFFVLFILKWSKIWIQLKKMIIKDS